MRVMLLRSLFLLVFLMLAGMARAQAPAPKTDYVLAAGDVIKVTVFQSPELSLESRIPESGVVSYPLLGVVKLGGLTISQAEKLLADGLLAGKYLKQPQVSILVTQIRGSQASVLGHAVRPGRYTLELASTRLSDLMALAGGIAPDGSDILTVVGTRDGKPLRVQIDFRTLFRGANDAQDILIQNNDVVYVDRAPQIYIYGEAQRPGALRLERGMTVLQALAAGGGLTAAGYPAGYSRDPQGPRRRGSGDSPLTCRTSCARATWSSFERACSDRVCDEFESVPIDAAGPEVGGRDDLPADGRHRDRGQPGADQAIHRDGDARGRPNSA